MNQSLDAMFYRGNQERTDYSGGAVSNGAVVDIGDRIGICTSPEGIAASGAGSLGALAVTGVFRLKKATSGSTVVFAKDGQVWWDTVAKTAYNAPGSNRIYAGLVDEAAVAAEDNVKCDINKLPTQQVVASALGGAGTTTTTTT